ncbi:DNA primase [Achromobacter insuavis]|uniref:DNA primase n=1 Tax=Achromobacter insuavis TaxID=1287735 RepID=UPI001F12AF81|nr:DNA primase [Achromobacter insuavis]
MDSTKQFADEYIDQVREATDLADLIGHSVTLKRTGGDFLGLCPFHNDTRPSFRVNVSQRRYRCWSCPAKGDAFAWLMNTQYVTFPEAVKILAGRAGIPLPAPSVDSAEDRARKRRLSRSYAVLSDAQRLYASGLKSAPDALRYLREERGLADETIQAFGLGAVRSGIWRYLSHRDDVDALLAAGILGLRDDQSLYERFRHRITFPIRNVRGAVIGFGGRLYFARRDDAPKYLNSPETELYQKHRELYALDLARQPICRASLAIVVEGYLDVVSLHQAGETRAVAPLGTAISEHQVRRLLGLADEICFVFDGDGAGRRAALAAAKVVLGEIPDGKRASFAYLQDGEDPDSLVRSGGIERWNEVLESRLPLSTVLTTFVAGQKALDVPENLVSAHDRAREVLKAIQRANVFRRAMQLAFEERLGLAL